MLNVPRGIEYIYPPNNTMPVGNTQNFPILSLMTCEFFKRFQQYFKQGEVTNPEIIIYPRTRFEGRGNDFIVVLWRAKSKS